MLVVFLSTLAGSRLRFIGLFSVEAIPFTSMCAVAVCAAQAG